MWKKAGCRLESRCRMCRYLSWIRMAELRQVAHQENYVLQVEVWLEVIGIYQN
ncbi:hypothetical protein D3C78_1739360 [compost metagenome]